MLRGLAEEVWAAWCLGVRGGCHALRGGGPPQRTSTREALQAAWEGGGGVGGFLLRVQQTRTRLLVQFVIETKPLLLLHAMLRRTPPQVSVFVLLY